MEETLNPVLDVVSKWDAVLRLNEADPFLEARPLHDLERNKKVSILPRILVSQSSLPQRRCGSELLTPAPGILRGCTIPDHKSHQQHRRSIPFVNQMEICMMTGSFGRNIQGRTPGPSWFWGSLGGLLVYDPREPPACWKSF